MYLYDFLTELTPALSDPDGWSIVLEERWLSYPGGRHKFQMRLTHPNATSLWVKVLRAGAQPIDIVLMAQVPDSSGDRLWTILNFKLTIRSATPLHTLVLCGFQSLLWGGFHPDGQRARAHILEHIQSLACRLDPLAPLLPMDWTLSGQLVIHAATSQQLLDVPPAVARLWQRIDPIMRNSKSLPAAKRLGRYGAFYVDTTTHLVLPTSAHERLRLRHHVLTPPDLPDYYLGYSSAFSTNMGSDAGLAAPVSDP